MPNRNSLRTWIAALAAAASLGCAACYRESCECGSGCTPGRTLCSAYQGELADELICCNRGCCGQSCPHWYEPEPCANCGPECYPCRDAFFLPFGLGCERLGMLRHRCKPSPGPPPVTMRPELPPKFLPVPTQPVLSPVRPDAPDPMRGDVEFDYRHEVTFPSRD